MRIVLVSIGTDGDIYPYVGLGAELKARGHSVTLSASQTYEALAHENGFAFAALVSAEENDELFAHPDFWHPIKTVGLSAKWGRRFLSRQYQLLSNLVTSESVLVASPGVFAAMLVHETQRCPLVSLVLQPGILPSCTAPPVMAGMSFLQGAPPWIWRIFWWLLDGIGGVVVGKELNRLRASLGLRPLHRMFRNWLSPQLAIGMFPDWYGPFQPDWPKQLQLTGFPLFDGGSDPECRADVLQFCKAGAPPVAFTFGTGMRHSAKLFQAATEAVRLGGMRAIFLTKHRDQLPDRLPASTIHCEFAPFRKLFPMCAAVVHHGGIGTVSQAMAAGIPQLIVPICFDQEDNGTRIKRLGIGSMLTARRRCPKNIVKALSDLASPEVLIRCKKISCRLTDRGAIERAASLIESLGARSRY